MEFLVLFADGDERWVTWTPDLFQCVPYAEYCQDRRSLQILLGSAAEARAQIRVCNKQAVNAVQPGDRVWVDLRWFSAAWYAALELPDKDLRTYCLPFRYGLLMPRSGGRKIRVVSELTQERFTVDNYFVTAWGSRRALSATDTEVTQDFVRAHPNIRPEASRVGILRAGA